MADYWKLNEMPRSGKCLGQKKRISYLKWIINFLISEVKQYEESMAKEQSQNGRGVIKSLKSPTQEKGFFKCIHVRTRREEWGREGGEKNVHKMCTY